MTIKNQFTKNEIREFRTQFKEAVKQLEKDFNVDINIGNIRYDAVEFSGKMTVKKTTKDAVAYAEDKIKSNFERLAPSYGVNPNWYGKTYISQGKTMKVVGINTRARKYPIMLKGSDGKSYKSSPSILRVMMNRK